MKKYSMKSVMLILLPILVIPLIGVAYAQTASEIDIATGAGSSSQASCVTTNNCFSPNPLTVAPGTTVTWKNTDTVSHYVVSGLSTDTTSGTVFDSGNMIKPGNSYQFTFANAGTYDYFCSVHPWMTGQIIVGASGTVPTPQPTQPTVSLTTDRQSYNQGDTIIISGKVSNSVQHVAVTLRIFNSHGDLLSVSQILPSSDGSFTKTILATGPLWADAGTYTVTYQYGSLGIPSNQTFYYNGGNGQSTVTPSVPTQPSPISPLITVSVDKSSYTYGNTIAVSGMVQQVVPGTPVSIEILDPNNNMALTDSVDVTPDGKYVYTTSAAGPYWKLNGSYTVKVQYGPPNVTAQTTFAFITNNQPTSAIYPLQFGGQIYNIPYTIQGGTVINIGLVSTQQSTLEISIITTTDGSITVTLPRSIIDAKTTSGQDTPFVTSIDGARVTPQSESANNSFRNITIQYLQGDSKIDITGTQIASGSTSNSNNPYLGCPDCNNNQQTQLTSGGTLKVGLSTDPMNPNTTGQTQLKINFLNKQDSTIQPHIDYKVNIIQGSNQIFGIPLTHTALGSVTIPIQFQNSGTYQIKVEVDGVLFQPIPSESTIFSLQIGTQMENGSKSHPTNPYLGCPDCNNTDNIQQIPPIAITVTTDKPVYDHNSQIMITGHVANSDQSHEIGVKITSPSGNVISAAQITVDNNGDFVNKISTVGSLWFENGQYTIQVQQIDRHGNGVGEIYSSVFQIVGDTPVIVSSSSATPPTPVITPTPQDIENINQAKNNQTIAAEINVRNDRAETTSIDNNVTVQTTNTTSDSLGVKVSAASQTGPKVIVFNLNATTINVSNLKDLGVMYDGKLISPAPNMDAILHAKSTDNPSFAIVVTQSGVQVLVLVPHFSTHTITLTNMSKVIPAVPEFGPIVGIITIASLIGSIIISRKFFIVTRVQ